MPHLAQDACRATMQSSDMLHTYQWLHSLEHNTEHFHLEAYALNALWADASCLCMDSTDLSSLGKGSQSSTFPRLSIERQHVSTTLCCADADRGIAYDSRFFWHVQGMHASPIKGTCCPAYSNTLPVIWSQSRKRERSPCPDEEQTGPSRQGHCQIPWPLKAKGKAYVAKHREIAPKGVVKCRE